MSSSPHSSDTPAGNPNYPAQSLMNNLGKGVFWVFIIRGVLAILFGILILAAPAAVAIALGIFVGAWLVVDGTLTIINANSARKANLHWGWELTAGIAYVVAGLIIAIIPLSFAVVTGVFILWMLGAGMLVRGIFSLASKSFRGWSKLLGVLDIIFGVFLIIMAIMGRSQTKKAFNK